MEKRPKVLVMLAIMGMVSLLCLVGYFLALHDISHDYASPETWVREGRSVPAWLPDWASCSGEWRMTIWGYIPMLMFHLAFLLTVIFHIVAHRKESTHTPTMSNS